MITYAQQLNYAKVFGESIIYGADCVLALAILHIQLTSRRLLPTHKVLLWMADVMFLLTSAHMVLLLYETFTATVPPRVLQAAVAIAQFQLLLGDSVLIWRVWVVWNHDYRVVLFPATLLLAGFVVGMMYAAEATSYNSLGKILPMPTVVLAVANTTLCTTLIAGRLAYLDRLINGHLAFGSGRDHTYRGVILMVVESGAILTVANIISLTLERLDHPGLHVMLDISAPLAYMVPTTIIVLSHLRLVSGGDTSNETTTAPVRFATFATQLTAGDGGAATSTGVERSVCGELTETARTSLEVGFAPGDDVEKQAGALEAFEDVPRAA